jgi:hypothetical protein
LSNYKYYCFNNFEFFIEDFYVVKGDDDNDFEEPLENYLLMNESGPRLLAVLGGFFLAVAFLTGQRKLRKLGSEQKKEQSAMVLVM